MTPERERVDAALAAAREAAGTFRTGRERALALLAVSLAEACMRAVREVDDDVWHLKTQLHRQAADLATALGGEAEEPPPDFGVPAGMGDGGVELSERDLVDQALERARRAAEGAALEPGHTDGLPQPTGTEGDWMRLAIGLAEAFVRQVRDLDDDVCHLADGVIEAGAKVAVAAAELRKLADRPPPEERKGWLR